MHTFKKQKNTGFTLIETLVAISILVIALTGPLSIISQAMRASFYSRDQITAYFLAQEAIEYVRNERDGNALKATPPAADDWLDGIVDDSAINAYSNGESDTIKMNLTRDTSGYVLAECSLGICPNLKYADPTLDENIGLIPYGQDNEMLPESKFRREVIFSEPFSNSDVEGDTSLARDRELIITVRVFWKTPSGENVVTVRDHITNWQIEKF